jgi:hypothetical protein
MRRFVVTTRMAVTLAVAACLTVLVVGPGSARTGQTVACRGGLSPSQAVAACLGAPVPALDPVGTEALWRNVVRARRLQRYADDCRPARVVLYAATDWIRVATRLAAKASPCAQYFVSVPPLASDKTRFRVGQAEKIRALGASVHALAEINFGAWATWVASNGGSWFGAGVEARTRMAAAGYDVTLGDTWAVNEISSAVRANTGAARANVRELLRGLFTGDGSLPSAQGVAFVVGIAQGAPDLLTYQARMESWLQDTAFWADMSLYVSDWSDEVYGDVRAWAVPGAPVTDRRDALNDYLQHRIVLARAGPDTVATARSFLESASTPLANAAWQWPSAFGWTDVPVDQMKGYVSAQVYALRAFARSGAQPVDRFGFAWAPRNTDGLSQGDFTAQTADLLDRLATAIRDSAVASDPNDPAAGACGPPAQNLYCGGDIDGARFNTAWQAFRTWELPAVTFTSAVQTVTAGAASAPLTVELRQGVTPRPAAADSSVTLTSSSTTGTFATAPEGPWTPTLALTVPAGAVGPAPFFFRDTRAAPVTLSAAAPANGTGAQIVTIAAAEPATLSLTPKVVVVAAGSKATITAAAADAFGNQVAADGVTWSIVPGTPATIAPNTGARTTLTATAAGNGSVLAILTTPVGTVSTAAPVAVTPPPLLRITALRATPARSAVRIRVTLVDAAAAPLRRGRITIVVLRNGKRHKRASAPIRAGAAVLSVAPARKGCYVVRVTAVDAPGLRWSGRTPTNRLCRSTK